MSNHSAKIKAELYRQLATMDKAGIPLIESITTLLPHANPKLNKALALLVNNLKLGKPIANAGITSGVFSDVDSLVIQAASDSGKLGETFDRLATHYDLESRLKQKIQSRMAFPAFIFILAVFIAPVSRLVRGDITTDQYLNLTMFFILKFALLLYLLFKLPYWLRKGFLKNLGLSELIDGLLLNIPVFNKYYIKHHITKCIETLGMLLQAGIPAFEALPKAVENIDNIKLRNSFNPVINHLLSHGTMTDALAMNHYIDKQGILLIKSGEVSGRLYESVNHYGQLARTKVTSAFEEFATWLPRIVYGVVCLYIANAILRSAAFLPRINF